MKEEEYMDMALSLAKRGLGATSPNPMVGAVLVRGRQIIGKGYHKKAGLPHAEVMAIESAKEATAGATMFVNLEPCSHWGKTPPCVQTIIKAGIRKVVVAMTDPNPRVNGKGVEALRKAGIEVKVGLREAEARRLNEAFVTYMEKGRPFFIAKAAISLDGKIATRTLDSKWISNEESREHASRLRSVMDGIIVGINTVVSDNPFLIPKLPRPKKYPVRLILDSRLRIPLTSEIVKTAEKYKTWIFAGEKAPEDKEMKLKGFGIEVLRVADGENGRLSLTHVSEELHKREIVSVLVEGGGEIHSAFLTAGLVDKVILFFAPIIIGGKGALNFVGGKGIDFLKNAHRINITTVKRFREDIYVEGYVHRNH
jgi:diaminohydroxyphosphoribosylaminopyrimidine deaminase / 5-amino-6-(5-phosphoribosylamino)uracil reductase